MGYVISAYREGDDPEKGWADGETYVFGTWMLEAEALEIAAEMEATGNWQVVVCDLRVRDGWKA